MQVMSEMMREGHGFNIQRKRSLDYYEASSAPYEPVSASIQRNGFLHMLPLQTSKAEMAKALSMYDLSLYRIGQYLVVDKPISGNCMYVYAQFSKLCLDLSWLVTHISKHENERKLSSDQWKPPCLPLLCWKQP